MCYLYHEEKAFAFLYIAGQKEWRENPHIFYEGEIHILFLPMTNIAFSYFSFFSSSCLLTQFFTPMVELSSILSYDVKRNEIIYTRDNDNTGDLKTTDSSKLFLKYQGCVLRLSIPSHPRIFRSSITNSVGVCRKCLIVSCFRSWVLPACLPSLTFHNWLHDWVTSLKLRNSSHVPPQPHTKRWIGGGV